MVRTTFVNGKEYYVISTSIEVDDLNVPIQMYVDVNKLDMSNKRKIHKYATILLDHPFKINKSKEQPVKKVWYKFW